MILVRRLFVVNYWNICVEDELSTSFLCAISSRKEYLCFTRRWRQLLCAHTNSVIVCIWIFEAMLVTERKTYYLDLQTLLKLLRNKSGTLSCKIKMNGQWGNGLISLKRGQIEQSLIEWSTGRIAGKEAFERLSSIEEWQVSFEDTPPMTSLSPASPYSSGIHPSPSMPPSYSPAPPLRTSPNTPIIPRVRNQLNSFMLTHYTPEQRTILRTVYELADGHTSIDQIKARVHVPPEIVEVALATLQQLGVIF